MDVRKSVSRKLEAYIVRLLECGDFTVREVAARAGVRESVVRAVAKEHGLTRAHNAWTPEEDALLREYYYDHGAVGMVKLLPRHPDRKNISYRARQLGLTTAIGPYGRHMRFRVVEGGAHGEQA